MPIGYLGLRAIIWGLEEWFRKSELSCDRAGLLAGQDVDAARRALMKLAGGAQLSELNPDAFREQAHEYDAVPDLRDSILKLLQLQGNTHPFAVVRFAELDYWATHGDVRADPGRGLPAPGHRRATRRSAMRSGARPTVLPGVLGPVRGPARSGIFRGVAETGGADGRRAVRPAAEPRRQQRQRRRRQLAGSSGRSRPLLAAGSGHQSGQRGGHESGQRMTRSSRWTTSRSYSGPSLLASQRVERPIRPGISAAS